MERVAVFVARQGDCDPRPDPMSLAVEVTPLGGVCAHLAGLEHPQPLCDVIDVVWMYGLVTGQSLRFVERIAEQPLKHDVGHQPAAFEVGDDDADGRVLEGFAEGLFTPAHGSHRPSAVVGRQTNRHRRQDRDRQGQQRHTRSLPERPKRNGEYSAQATEQCRSKRPQPQRCERERYTDQLKRKSHVVNGYARDAHATCHERQVPQSVGFRNQSS